MTSLPKQHPRLLHEHFTIHKNHHLHQHRLAQRLVQPQRRTFLTSTRSFGKMQIHSRETLVASMKKIFLEKFPKTAASTRPSGKPVWLSASIIKAPS